MTNNTIVGDSNDAPVADKTELDLKITKITSMLDTVDKRIEAHERQLSKLYHIAERADARDKIARLTQSILESQ